MSVARFASVLRDSACVVLLWGTSENYRLQSMISIFRFVVSAVLHTCVHGEHGNFVSGGNTEHRWRSDCMCCGSGVSCGLTLRRKCTFAPHVFLREWRNMGQAPIAVRRRVAASAVVAVSSQVVVKCA